MSKKEKIKPNSIFKAFSKISTYCNNSSKLPPNISLRLRVLRRVIVFLGDKNFIEMCIEMPLFSLTQLILFKLTLESIFNSWLAIASALPLV